MFFGIIIRMFYNEHNPPHFHAEYQGQKGVFDFEGNLVKGSFTSKTACFLIKKWAVENQNELKENWDNIQTNKELKRIKPLD